MGIANRNQLVLRQQRQRKRPTHLRERFHDGFLDGGRLRSRVQMQDDFGVGGRLEDGAIAHHLVLQLAGIDEISVVTDGNLTVSAIDKERAGIGGTTLAGGRIAHVPHGQTSREAAEHGLVEGLVDVGHGARDVQALAVRRGDAGALLSAMLESVEAEIGHVRGFEMTVNPEHAAFFFELVHFLVVMGPHPHDLYFAPLALGVICYDDPLSERFFCRLHPRELYLALSALGVICYDFPLSSADPSAFAELYFAICPSRALKGPRYIPVLNDSNGPNGPNGPNDLSNRPSESSSPAPCSRWFLLRSRHVDRRFSVNRHEIREPPVCPIARAGTPTSAARARIVATCRFSIDITIRDGPSPNNVAMTVQLIGWRTPSPGASLAGTPSPAPLRAPLSRQAYSVTAGRSTVRPIPPVSNAHSASVTARPPSAQSWAERISPSRTPSMTRRWTARSSVKSTGAGRPRTSE